MFKSRFVFILLIVTMTCLVSCSGKKEMPMVSSSIPSNASSEAFDPKQYQVKTVSDEFINNPFTFNPIELINGDFDKIGKVISKEQSNNQIEKEDYPYSIKVEYDGLSIYIGTYDEKNNGRPIYIINKPTYLLANGLKVGDPIKKAYELMGKPDIETSEYIYYESKTFYSIEISFVDMTITSIKWEKQP